jgi:hypothetical protein
MKLKSLNEGVDIDIYERTVIITNNHQKGVDTSVTAHVTKYTTKKVFSKEIFNVISIFERNNLKIEGINNDGNPLIYALKGIKNWRLKDPRQFDELLEIACKKCKQITNKYDTMIIIPSTSDINEIYSKKILKELQCNFIFKEPLFIKPTTDEAINNKIDIEISESHFREHGLESKFEVIYDTIINSLSKMGEFFEIKKIIPEYMREYIPFVFDLGMFIDIKNVDNLYKFSQLKYEFYMKHLYNKDILLFDDNFVSGTSLTIYAENLVRLFAPKSITFLTIFSKKFYKNI